MRFLNDAVTLLQDFKHLGVVVPPVHAEMFCDALESHLNGSLGPTTRVALDGSGPPEPHVNICRSLGITPVPPRPEDFFAANEVPTRFLLVEIRDCVGPQHRTAVADFLARAASFAQVNEFIPFQLGVLVPHPAWLPARDVRFDQLVWWNRLSTLDIEVVAEEAARLFPTVGRARNYWQRALCKGVAITDGRLARLLVETMPRDVNAVKTLLRNEGRLSFDVQASVGIPPFTPYMLGDKTPAYPANGQGHLLWQHDALTVVEGVGIFINSAALPAEDFDKEVHRRVCAGQLSILMPVVEQVRLGLVRWLDRQSRSKWPGDIPKPGSSEFNKAVVEIGPLAYTFFQNSNPLRRFNGFIEAQSVAWCWRDIRNSLAHAEPLSLDYMERAFSLWENFISF